MLSFLDEVPLMKDPYGAKSRWLPQPKVGDRVAIRKKKRFGAISVIDSLVSFDGGS